MSPGISAIAPLSGSHVHETLLTFSGNMGHRTQKMSSEMSPGDQLALSLAPQILDMEIESQREAVSDRRTYSVLLPV